MNAEAHLRMSKSINTVIWAFFATCVVSIPYQAGLESLMSCLVSLLSSRWRSWYWL